jgi:hypothetical protein
MGKTLSLGSCHLGRTELFTISNIVISYLWLIFININSLHLITVLHCVSPAVFSDIFFFQEYGQ